MQIHSKVAIGAIKNRICCAKSKQGEKPFNDCMSRVPRNVGRQSMPTMGKAGMGS